MKDNGTATSTLNITRFPQITGQNGRIHEIDDLSSKLRGCSLVPGFTWEAPFLPTRVARCHSRGHKR